MIRRNPKILIGFSDITGLHIAINQQTGLVTFHSPNPELGLGSRRKPLAVRGEMVLAGAFSRRNTTTGVGNELQGLHDLTRSRATTTTRTTRKLFEDVPQPVTLARRQSPRPAHRRQPLGAPRADGHAVRNRNRRQDSVPRRRRRSAVPRRPHAVARCSWPASSTTSPA